LNDDEVRELYLSYGEEGPFTNRYQKPVLNAGPDQSTHNPCQPQENQPKTALPKLNHLAIIMDGNRRWAKKRGLSPIQGHIEGVKRVEDIIDISDELGIKAITLFAFSTENWQRPEPEVSLIMSLLSAVLDRKIKKLHEDNMQFRTIGRQVGLSNMILDKITRAVEQTKNNTGLIINLAFNYGARAEIIDAIKMIAGEVKDGRIGVEDINEECVSRHLYTKGLVDPDLLIRTSGEQRISNFLLWQLSYAELYFTDVLWPDFSKEEFLKAISAFQKRERRFGHAEGVNISHGK
jgi:undecaprenyl diphosphate synthase